LIFYSQLPPPNSGRDFYGALQIHPPKATPKPLIAWHFGCRVSSASSGDLLRLALARRYTKRGNSLVFMRQRLVFFPYFRRCNNAAMRFIMPSYLRTKLQPRFVPYPMPRRLFHFLLTLCIISVFGLHQLPPS